MRQEIQQAVALAPLHNPPNLHGIDAAFAEFPDAPHVSVLHTLTPGVTPPHTHTRS